VKTDWRDIDGTVASVDRDPGSRYEQYVVAFTYVVDGHWCGSTFSTNVAYRVGDTIPVRCDAANPDRNDLSEGYRRNRWLAWVVAAVVLLIVVLIRLS
jgi:hypothetical protein